MYVTIAQYGFTKTKGYIIALVADNTQYRQNEKYFKNDDLRKTVEKMVHNTAAHNSRYCRVNRNA